VQVNRSWWLAALSSIILFGALIFLLTQIPTFTATAPSLSGDTEMLLEDLGRALVDVNRYIIPFEVASVLLLAALIGSIIIAWPLVDRKREEGE
jgi:NADH-quinone oxidoreductase subunit J